METHYFGIRSIDDTFYCEPMSELKLLPQYRFVVEVIPVYNRNGNGEMHIVYHEDNLYSDYIRWGNWLITNIIIMYYDWGTITYHAKAKDNEGQVFEWKFNASRHIGINPSDILLLTQQLIEDMQRYESKAHYDLLEKLYWTRRSWKDTDKLNIQEYRTKLNSIADIVEQFSQLTLSNKARLSIMNSINNIIKDFNDTYIESIK